MLALFELERCHKLHRQNRVRLYETITTRRVSYTIFFLLQKLNPLSSYAARCASPLSLVSAEQS